MLSMPRPPPPASDDEPRSLRDAGVRQRREMMLEDAHMAPLTQYVRTLRASTQDPRDIPWFDPLDGGMQARALFVLESPGPKALESGFISANNPDQTAARTWCMRKDARLRRSDLLVWNIVPWYLRNGKSFRAPNGEELRLGARHLKDVLKLASHIEFVVTQGKPATRAWKLIAADIDPHNRFKHIETSHPSPQNLNTRRDQQALLAENLQELARLLG